MQRSSSTTASAVASTQAITSSMLASAVPGQLADSGQFSHQVRLLPPLHFPVPVSQVCPSFTVPPRFVVQSFSSTAAMHALPIPTWQQKAALAVGVRLPHLFLMAVIFFVSAALSASATFGFAITSKHCALVCPRSPQLSRTFSRVRRYLKPALPIAFWQSSSPLDPRSCWSGNGVVQSSSEQVVEPASSEPHVSRACEAYTMATNSASSAAFQHSKQAASSAPVPAGIPEQVVSAAVSGVARLQVVA